MWWPLSMVSRTTMRAVAWPGAIWSIWMPRWREARSASYILVAERWTTACGSSCTRPPRTGWALGWPSANHDDPDRLWVAAAGEGCGMVLAGVEAGLLEEGRVPRGGCAVAG